MKPKKWKYFNGKEKYEIALAIREGITIQYHCSSGWSDCADGLPVFDDNVAYRRKPKMTTHWSNVYEDSLGILRKSREECDEVNHTSSRIGVVRIERIEGQPPEYFHEDV